jgi:hypothetical protein
MLSVFAAIKQIVGMEDECIAEIGRNPVFQYFYLCREGSPLFVRIKDYPGDRRRRLFERMSGFVEIDNAHSFVPIKGPPPNALPHWRGLLP